MIFHQIQVTKNYLRCPLKFFYLESSAQNIRIQRIVAILSVILFLVKLYAWYVSRSVAILTDALEGIVNIVAGFIGWYSLHISAKPRDADHPYGHGKIEFISSAVEGAFISMAGLFIIFKAVQSFFNPAVVHNLGLGIILITATGVINFLVGRWCYRVGAKNNSPALMSSGKHLQSDTYTTIGILVGLVLFYFTKIWWIDAAVAIIFAFIIVWTGIKIIRASVGGIMDEADEKLLQKLVDTLNKERRINWIDLHNTRIIKYGATMHIDCHLTVPWYFNVVEAHQEIDYLSALINKEYGGLVELFVHSDACMEFSCAICHKGDCPVRKHPYEKTIVWTRANIRENVKHSLETK